jgi:hypothetical protein
VPLVGPYEPLRTLIFHGKPHLFIGVNNPFGRLESERTERPLLLEIRKPGEPTGIEKKASFFCAVAEQVPTGERGWVAPSR